MSEYIRHLTKNRGSLQSCLLQDVGVAKFELDIFHRDLNIIKITVYVNWGSCHVYVNISTGALLYAPKRRNTHYARWQLKITYYNTWQFTNCCLCGVVTNGCLKFHTKRRIIMITFQQSLLNKIWQNWSGYCSLYLLFFLLADQIVPWIFKVKINFTYF